MEKKVREWGQNQIFGHLFKDEKETVFEKMDQLENALNKLQYEGKFFSSGHIKRAEEVVYFLKRKFADHIRMDNLIVFPFLEKHIPRLYTALLYLKAERREFQESFKNFEKIFLELKKNNKNVLRNDIIERLKNKGIYLICLMRSHIQFEEQSVYKSIQQVLSAEERRELMQEIINFRMKKETRLNNLISAGMPI